MPVASIDDKGTQIYYEDSGSPNSQTYTTVVLVHGTAFHGGIFKRLFPLAPEWDMRLVSINLRDYPGSTPYTSSELASLRSTEPKHHASFIRSRGIELATFLAWYIRKEKIPPRTDFSAGNAPSGARTEGSYGGLAVLGWSSGNCMAISLFSHSDIIPQEIRGLLEKYIRTFILFGDTFDRFSAYQTISLKSPFVDPTLYSLGIIAPPPTELPCPVRGPDSSYNDAAAVFAVWVSSYYAHEPISTAALTSLTRSQILSKISSVPLPDSPFSGNRRPTLNRMTMDELRSVTEYERRAGTHVDILNVHNTVYADNVRRLLSEVTVWPHLRVELVWCDMAVGDCIYVAWSFVHLLARFRNNGNMCRPASIKRFHNANHFPHWDMPKDTMQLLSEIV